MINELQREEQRRHLMLLCVRDDINHAMCGVFVNSDWSGCIRLGSKSINWFVITLSYSFRLWFNREIRQTFFVFFWGGGSFPGFGSVIIRASRKEDEVAAALKSWVRWFRRMCLKCLTYSTTKPPRPGDVLFERESKALLISMLLNGELRCSNWVVVRLVRLSSCTALGKD